MPKVEFIKPWVVKQGDGKGPRYKIGDVVDLERSYADKYKARGLAVDYVPPARLAPKVVEALTVIPADVSAGDVGSAPLIDVVPAKTTAFRRK